MNKIIIIALLLSINVFGYRWTNYDIVGYVGGMCGESGALTLNLNSFSSYWQPVMKQILTSAINYWNEAGSEHILSYADVGGSDVYYTDSYSSTSDTLATCHTEVSLTTLDCLSTGSAYIKINKKKWYDNDSSETGDIYDIANSYRMQIVLTHELGHYLGLAHTQDYDTYFYMDERTTPQSDWDDYPIMMYAYHELTAHLTEDDKYGVRSMYGKDDNSLLSLNSLNNVVTYYTTNNAAYQTYSKPQLTYQPNRNTNSRAYDYIMTWIKSDTRQINYRFVSECSNNTDICAATDMTSGNGMTLGEVHTITGSETLTSPSLAMKSDGSQAMIVWKQETENQQGYNSDDIYYALINGNEHSGSITGIKIHDNYLDFVQDYVAKSMFAPKVVWVDAWNRYVMFYTDITPAGRLGIAYIVAESNGTFASEPYIGYLQQNGSLLKSNWNSFEVNCNQVKTASSKVCVLVYNKISTSDNFVSADSVSKADFKILTPNSYNYYFTVENVVDNATYNDSILNYGHYSIAAKPEPTNLKTYYTLNFIRGTTFQRLTNYNFNITYNGSSWIMNDSEIYQNQEYNTQSLSGQSILYNARENFYKYLWIYE